VTVAESALRRLLVQSSHYSLASLLTIVAGLITFPLLTRIFSVADYGHMNLIAATISVAVAFGKIGVQHSIVRYESEISAGKRPFTLPQLYSTTLVGMTASAVAATLVLVVATQLVPIRWLGSPELRPLFAIASLLLLVQVVESALINFLRAAQNTAALMKYQVVKKYFGLGLILLAVLLVSRSLVSFYSASVISEVVAVLALGTFLFRDAKRPVPKLADFSRPLYLEMLGFGIPMMIGYELSGIVLAVGDRYVIEGLMGAASLGLYSAAYNLCQYVQSIVIASVGQAIMPLYMQMWDRQGPQETAAFVARSLRTYALFGAPVIAGIAAIGPDLLPSLASDKYSSASVVLPWVIAGMVVDGTNSMVGAGLFIHRKTRIIMAIVLSGAALNLALNVLLVPRIGILGAAVATLVCYAATALGMAIAGRHLLPVALPWATLVRAGLASVAMYLVLQPIYPGRRLLTVGVRLIIGAPVYCAAMGLIDPDARAILRGVANKLRSILAKRRAS
jgi:O-antigen/teichoic acid export membrane protein